ncbi:DsbA family protein [Qipengyuania marisflavi]|uniref:DsbA family protein n=1 Tax=Qipengyuania marisflavi TaxID=2486356 RepID=A0A5S3P5N6_9SPHN|nr:DsbA family protein [Qipengyuania marisflavi]TMM48264.1 DsbA family protein [Qipengyuania marisflavi]
MKNHLITALIALVFGFAGAGLWAASGLGNGLTRSYLVGNPDILPAMAEAYQQKQAEDRLADVGGAVTTPFPGAVLGNPEGSKTLVEFTDYGCTYCRMSIADVDRLAQEDPDLKIVVREWPIFDGSEDAARMGLAAAKQGKFAAYYHAVFDLGPPSAASVEQAARTAGMDLSAARLFAASDAVTAEIAKNREFARKLGFSGTPSWIAGGSTLEGYVGYDRLAAAIAGDS